jgi:hypothetical protein
MREDVASLRDITETESGAFFGAKAFEFVSNEVDVATLRGHETDDGTKRGGLTYTVSTHETEDGFLRHVEVDST